MDALLNQHLVICYQMLLSQRSERAQVVDLIGEPGRDRTDDLFHAIDPTLGFLTTYKTPVAP